MGYKVTFLVFQSSYTPMTFSFQRRLGYIPKNQIFAAAKFQDKEMTEQEVKRYLRQ